MLHEYSLSTNSVNELFSFEERKVDRDNKQSKRHKVVPVKLLITEDQSYKYCENRERDNFLQNFQLHQCERTAIACKAHAVGWNHQRVFKESDAP